MQHVACWLTAQCTAQIQIQSSLSAEKRPLKEQFWECDVDTQDMFENYDDMEEDMDYAKDFSEVCTQAPS